MRIDEITEARLRLPKVLYHGTKNTLIPAILREGLRPELIQSGGHDRGVFLATDAYNAGMYPDHDVGPGEHRVVLAIDVSQLVPGYFGPDLDDWYGDVDWRDLDEPEQVQYSLRELGQVVYNDWIPPRAISVFGNGDDTEAAPL